MLSASLSRNVIANIYQGPIPPVKCIRIIIFLKNSDNSTMKQIHNAVNQMLAIIAAAPELFCLARQGDMG
jgi:hypothetical protein